jgi:TP901 family phage tail tape measure protein
MMSKLANMDTAQATEYLTSMINGFKISVDDVVPTIDKLVALDNSFATSVSEIAAAMQRTSNVAQQEGVTFDQLAGYIK